MPIPLHYWLNNLYPKGGIYMHYILINSIVHILMYSYYLIVGLNPIIRRLKLLLTEFQLLQFYSCIIIAFASYFYNGFVWFGFSMYMSISLLMIYMFTNFYKKTLIKDSSLLTMRKISIFIFIWIVGLIYIPIKVFCKYYLKYYINYLDYSWIDLCYLELINYLKIKHKVPKYNKKAEIILANHRCWIDPILLQTNVTGISRGMYALVILPFTLIALYSKQIIIISRGKTDRNALYKLISYNKKQTKLPVLYYAEGSRQQHMKLPLNIEDINLKAGELKMIYDNNMKFQIIIMKNNEQIFNEKQLTINYNVETYHYISDLFDPIDWKKQNKSFDVFYLDIKKHWADSWYKVYDK